MPLRAYQPVLHQGFVHQDQNVTRDILQRMIGEQIQTVVVLYPQTGRSLVDSIQLEQVIMNLMLNTRDARELLPPG